MSIVLNGTTGITSTGITETSDGNVGIGANSPAHKLDISGTAYGGVYIKSTSANFSGMLIENTNSATKWQVGVEGGTYIGAGTFNIGIDAVGSKLAIDTSGHLIVPAGITLGTAAATYAAANTLDDYEEGTWTPEFIALSGTMQTVNYGGRVGKYTKIGNVVHADFLVPWTSTSGSGSGLLALSLPFAPYGNGGAHNGFGGISYASGLPTTAHLYGDSGSTRAVLIKANGTSNSYYSPSEISSGGGQIMGRFIFHTT